MRLNDLPIRTGHLFIGLAILMGIITVSLLFTSLKKEPDQEVAVKERTVKAEQVVVAMSPILRGEQLTPDNIKTVKWPADFLPSGVYFDSTAGLMGRVALQDIFPGEPIYQQKLAGPYSKGLPAVIPKGLRAVSIKVSEVKGVAGFVKPGDRVDVLATFHSGDDERTVTVLQNVLVLAAAQSMMDDHNYEIDTPKGVLQGEAGVGEEAVEEEQSDKGGKAKDKKPNEKDLAAKKKEEEAERKRIQKERLEAEKRAKLVSSVTLGLTPEEVEIITTAEETASLRLALRSDTDHDVASLSGASQSELLMPGGNKGMVDLESLMPTPPDAMLSTWNVEFIEGTVKSSVAF